MRKTDENGVPPCLAAFWGSPKAPRKIEGLLVGLAMGENERFSGVGDGNPATGGPIFDGGPWEALKAGAPSRKTSFAALRKPRNPPR